MKRHLANTTIRKAQDICRTLATSPAPQAMPLLYKDFTPSVMWLIREMDGHVNQMFTDLWVNDGSNAAQRQGKLHELARAIDATVAQHKSDGRPHTFLPQLE